MKALLAILALGTGAPTLAETAEQTAIMQAIEAAVALPEGAGSLDEYSRNYAIGPDGKVLAYYVIPFATLITNEEDGCEVMLEDLESRPCTDEEVAEMIQDDLARAERMGKPGQSRWFYSYGELPLVLDGGCNFIEIIYDPQTMRVERAECNGDA
jgi:hypothetical protein